MRLPVTLAALLAVSCAAVHSDDICAGPDWTEGACGEGFLAVCEPAEGPPLPALCSETGYARNPQWACYTPEGCPPEGVAVCVEECP